MAPTELGSPMPMNWDGTNVRRAYPKLVPEANGRQKLADITFRADQRCWAGHRLNRPGAIWVLRIAHDPIDSADQPIATPR